MADSRLDPLLSPVASENQRGEIGSGISNARGISKAQSPEGKIGNRLPWIDGLGRAQCHIVTVHVPAQADDSYLRSFNEEYSEGMPPSN